MHAVLVGNQGKLVWSPVPDPVLKDDDVLLEIHAAALNRADLLQRAGQYPPPEGWPEWFGLEAAGIIRALGPKAEAEGKWHVGDAVCALLGGGGYAEYVAVPSGMLMPIPKGMTMEEAMAEVKMVVEGGYSAKAARELAEKYEVSMPIVEKVNQVLFEGKPAKDAVSELMMRDGRSEYSNLPWD